ncbi:MAG: GH3 auxin-responsive promoter family protein [Phycisphaerales bacterium]|nr:GH3 auxin-responsive promoter family protein [Phycisphaerales bacterium]
MLTRLKKINSSQKIFTSLKVLTYPIDSNKQQLRILKKLIRKAQNTEFGKKYNFKEILDSTKPYEQFQQQVPIVDYNEIYKTWWYKTLEGQKNICWPGKIVYFALSSGTSDASSKYIPITDDMIKGNRKTMFRYLMTLWNYKKISYKSIGKGWLMLGGSTELQKTGHYYAGDWSGISAKKAPFWFSPFYKPGKKISQESDWNKKLQKIVLQAPKWDIGVLVGVPSWIQICIQMIIDHYKVPNIHVIWPNLCYFVHGGVSFEPYKKSFDKLLGKPITYIETYLASEGFIAYQSKQQSNNLKLVTNQNLFFEFIPFDDHNFNAEGTLLKGPTVHLLNSVEENKEYAIILSSVAGAWRYILGDTIRFVDKKKAEIIITGRIKHFLSLVGEHLSVDNMTRAVHLVGEELNTSFNEFTVYGGRYQNNFAHHWFLSCEDKGLSATSVQSLLDGYLKKMNDDYAVERVSALQDVFVTLISHSYFIEFLEKQGKLGSQNKFPRVLKGNSLRLWKIFLHEKGIETII